MKIKSVEILAYCEHCGKDLRVTVIGSDNKIYTVGVDSKHDCRPAPHAPDSGEAAPNRGSSE
jgi:hypothetical protein